MIWCTVSEQEERALVEVVAEVAGAKMFLKCSEFRVGSAIFASDAPNAGTRSTTSMVVAVAVGGTFLLNRTQHVPSHTSQLDTRRRNTHQGYRAYAQWPTIVYKIQIPLQTARFIGPSS